MPRHEQVERTDNLGIGDADSPATFPELARWLNGCRGVKKPGSTSPHRLGDNWSAAARPEVFELALPPDFLFVAVIS